MFKRPSFASIQKFREVELRSFAGKVQLPQQVEIIDYTEGEPAQKKEV